MRVLGRTRRVHFVGIGGIGMSGIAELLANLSYEVTGSDAVQTPVTRRLADLGIRVFEGHAPSHVEGADVVVVSAAVRPENPEVEEARRRQIPVIPRAEMLAELMRLRYAVAVAGSHGKTTTTSMIALVLERAGLDPTAVIGGRLSAFGSNARLGQGELMVAEADESDRSFLRLSPAIAVMTNVDSEHLEAYGSFERLQQAFVDFANKVPFHGAVVACADDPGLAGVLPRIERRLRTYGIGVEADLTAVEIEQGPLSVRAIVRQRRLGSGGMADVLGELWLNVPGVHNLRNALAAVAVGQELGLAFDRIAAGLREFRGVDRRLDVRGEPGGVLVIDDYGHHPTEISAVLAAVAPLRRPVIVAFQPHRFSRTSALMDAFGPSLGGAHHVVLTDIYPAGEDPLPGVTVDTLAAAMRQALAAPVDVVRRLDDVAPALVRLARPGDVVITLGAGSIAAVADRVVRTLAARSRGGVQARMESSA